MSTKKEIKFSLLEEGDYCTSDKILYPDIVRVGDYQWYRDGIAIVCQTFIVLSLLVYE